jgi:hypothetical protein
MTVATNPEMPPSPMLPKTKKFKAIRPNPTAVNVKGSMSSTTLTFTLIFSLSDGFRLRRISSSVYPNLESRSSSSSPAIHKGRNWCIRTFACCLAVEREFCGWKRSVTPNPFAAWIMSVATSRARDVHRNRSGVMVRNADFNTEFCCVPSNFELRRSSKVCYSTLNEVIVTPTRQNEDVNQTPSNS